MAGRWDKKENEFDCNRKRKTFVDKGDGKKPSHSPTDESFEGIFDKIKKLTGNSTNADSSDVKYYRVFFIRTIDNKIDDILVEHHKSNESVYASLVINSDHKMERKKTENGVVMFEWEGKPKNGKPVYYTAISYAIREEDI